VLVYTSTKTEFLDDVRANNIDQKILASFQRHLGHSTSKNEITAWRNSMLYMSQVLADDEIPANSGVAIEYTLPQTTKRIDFILTGIGQNKQVTVIIIELKQWESVKGTSMDGIVRHSLVERSAKSVILHIRLGPMPPCWKTSTKQCSWKTSVCSPVPTCTIASRMTLLMILSTNITPVRLLRFSVKMRKNSPTSSSAMSNTVIPVK
jgi:hypothetical protein